MVSIAVELAAAYVNIIPSARGFGQKLGREISQPLTRASRDAGTSASKEFGGRFSSGLRSVGRIAAGVLIAGGVRAGFRALTNQLGSFVTEAREAGKVNRLTNEVLKSTGGIANVTAQQIGALATRLSTLSGVDDEVIQSGENVLATFTNIRNQIGAGNNIFDQATESALNMSAALGQDMQSSVIQLGKALNDPIKGITALSRVGVSFTAQQKEQIKALVASGDVLGAQKVILKELAVEFGGAAAAAADPMARLQVIFGNFKEQLGGALLPTINKLADSFGVLLPQIATALTPIIATLVPALTSAFGALIPAIGPILRTLAAFLAELGGTFADTFGALKPVFAALAPVVSELGSSFLLIVQSLLPLLPVFGQLVAAVAPLGEAVGGVLTIAIRSLVPLITPLIGTLARLAEAFIGNAETPGPLIALLGALGGAVQTFARLLLPIIPRIGELAATLVTGLAPVLPDLAKAFGQLLVAVAPLVPTLVELAVVLIEQIGIPTIVGIAVAMTKLAEALTPLLANTTVLTPLVAALGAAFLASKGIQSFQKGLLGVATAGGKAARALQAHVDVLQRAVAPFVKVGRAAITGAINIARQTAAFVAQKTAMVASAIATKVLAVAQAALNLVMTANPIGLVIVAVAALAAGIFFAYKKFKPFRDIVDAVGRALKGAFEFVKRNWKLIVGLLVAPFITVPILIVKNFSKITAFLSKFGGVLGKAGIALMRALGVGIVKGIQALAILFIGIPILIVKLLVQGHILLARKGVELIRFLVGGFVSALPTIAAFFIGLPGKILGFIGNVAAILVPKAIELMTGFATALIGAQIAVATFFLGLPGRIVTFVGKLATTLVPKAVELIGGFALGLLQAIPRVFTFFVSLPSRIIGAFGALGTKLIPKALELIAGFMVGLFEAQHKIFDFFISLPGEIIGWLGKLGDILLEAGKDIIKGLFEGMKEGVKGGAGFVNDNVVKPVKGFVTNPFGIFSPSKWAADVVGKNIILGIAEGLVKNTKIIDGTLAGVVGNFDPTLGVDAGTFAVGSSAGRSAPNVNIENLFARDDRDVARVVGDQQRRAWLLANAF